MPNGVSQVQGGLSLLLSEALSVGAFGNLFTLPGNVVQAWAVFSADPGAIDIRENANPTRIDHIEDGKCGWKLYPEPCIGGVNDTRAFQIQGTNACTVTVYCLTQALGYRVA